MYNNCTCCNAAAISGITHVQYSSTYVMGCFRAVIHTFLYTRSSRRSANRRQQTRPSSLRISESSATAIISENTTTTTIIANSEPVKTHVVKSENVNKPAEVVQTTDNNLTIIEASAEPVKAQVKSESLLVKPEIAVNKTTAQVLKPIVSEPISEIMTNPADSSLAKSDSGFSEKTGAELGIEESEDDDCDYESYKKEELSIEKAHKIFDKKFGATTESGFSGFEDDLSDDDDDDSVIVDQKTAKNGDY
jgi:hypothetical protein